MAEERGIPRAIVINRMDRENANFGTAFDQARATLSKRCVPIQLPIGSQDGFKGIVDIVEMKAYLGDPSTGSGRMTPAELPEDMAAQIKQARDALLELAAEADDDLTLKYLEGEELTPEEVRRGLEEGIAAGTVIPVMVASAAKAIGVPTLLDAVTQYFPSPAACTKPAARTSNSRRR
jgi:elongation factor G